MKRLLIALALLFALPAIAEEITGIGKTYWSRTQSISTTTACVVRQQGSTDCALFPAGQSPDHRRRASIVTASGAGKCCYTLEAGSAIDITANLAMDVGGLGQGVCWEFPAAGGEWHNNPDRKLAIAAGAKGAEDTGLCSLPVTTTHGEDLGVYAPCDADADCSAISAGTCTALASLSDSQIARAAMYLQCEGTAGAVLFTARKERIQ